MNCAPQAVGGQCSSYTHQLFRRFTFRPSGLVSRAWQLATWLYSTASRFTSLLYPRLTSPLRQRMTTETSLGKHTYLLLIAAVSTSRSLLVAAFDMMCCLDHFGEPLIRFLFVRTSICSPAYFRPGVTSRALVAC